MGNITHEQPSALCYAHSQEAAPQRQYFGFKRGNSLVYSASSTPQNEKERGKDRYSLPVQLTPFVGREQEIATVCTLLRQPETRLLTLIGTGGVGKTRLGLQVATCLADEFDDQVYFISLI